MTERCGSCGAELFEGQQFCRACGAPTRQFSGEELPTQLLPHQQQQQQPQPTQPPQTPLSTAPLSGGRNTSDPIYGAGYQAYQPPVVAPPQQQRHTSPVGGAPPSPQLSPRRRSRGWLYAVVALLIFFGGASLVAGLFIANRSPRVVRVTRPKVVVPTVPDIPPLPPLEAGDEAAGLLENEGAEVSGNQTTITKTYPLAKNGSFALHNISGDITIEGWDEQEAEVKIIKRGGSPQARDALRIMREQSADRLAFNTMPEMRAGGVEEVRYEVKLPRNLRELEVVSNNSNLVVVNANAGSISLVVQRGNIKLEDVSGTVNSRTTKGNTIVVIGSDGDPARTAPQVFNGISGNMELELSPDTNAELKVETISGDIEIDEDLGIKVEKRMVGQQAVGRIGKGGQPIVVKTVSGNIKIRS